MTSIRDEIEQKRAVIKDIQLEVVSITHARTDTTISALL